MSSHPVFADELKEIVQSFVVETQEILDELNSDLLRLEKADDTRPLIDQIFRAVHTVKGTCSFLGLDQLALVTHHFEDVLNRLRRRRVIIHPHEMDVMFAAFDAMSVLFQQVVDGTIVEIRIDPLLDDLQLLADGGIAGDGAPANRFLHTSRLPSTHGGAITRSGPERPLSMWPASRDPHFEENSVPVDKSTPAEDAAVRSRASDTLRIGVDRIDHLVGLAGEAAARRANMARTLALLGADAGGRPTSTVETFEKQRGHTPRPISGNESACLLHELSAAVDGLGRVLDSMQSAVLDIRMVPVGTVFSRFHRVARDLAIELGKEVDLHVEGGEIELDRSLVDHIADPLLHLVRNAIDHGIEPPAERARARKRASGRLALSAESLGAGVLLKVEDDGVGIDEEALRARAVEFGFGSAGEIASMPAAAVRNLIFEPGFTAHQKANRISGRGVGLDVVKTSFERLGGTVRVESERGFYTRFIVNLPQSTVIERCLLVECGKATFAVPTHSIRSILNESEVDPSACRAPLPVEYADIRVVEPSWSATMPVDDRRERDRLREGRTALILGHGDVRGCLFVDRVCHEQQLIITSTSRDGAAATGITGSARIGLDRSASVLDINALLVPDTEGSVRRESTETTS